MNLRRILAITVVLLVLPASAAVADDQPYVAVGQAKAKRTVIALPEILTTPALSAATDEIQKLVNEDLTFMDQFTLLGKAAFVEKSGGIAPGSFKIEDWSQIGAEFLAKSQASTNEKGFQLELYLYNVSANKVVLSKRYISTLGEARAVAHSLANDIVNTITGLPGIFQTKIAMICDRTRHKEVYMMDFDGTNVKQVTHHNSTTVGPAWSPDGTMIAYSLYAKNRQNVKNLNLYDFDFKSSTIRLLSDRKTSNTGACYNPADGKHIALTMNFLNHEDPDIFIFNPDSKSVTRITKSAGVNVDPSFSPDGKQIVFVSSRAGASMIYKMNGDGTGVQRLTFAGKYNATPSWSPQGQKIAFAGWIDSGFDIFEMNTDGTNIERLTKNQGTNEDPSFSPDGNFIIFSSSRSGGRNIYVMNTEGTFVKRLTYGLGSCVSPKWSNPPPK